MQSTPTMLLSRQRSVSSSSSSLNSNGSGTWFPASSSPPSPPTSPPESPPFESQPHQSAHETTPQHRNSFQNTSHTTPRTCNGKRRLPSTSSTNNNNPHHNLKHTSSFDCQSLQHSLKRVRLSSSPGELRLQSDLRQLVARNSPWHQVHDDVWVGSGCRLERCTVDPLRLVVSISRTATFRLQFPRMYPHQPPTVTRMVEPPLWMHHHVPQPPHQRNNVLIPLQTAPPIPAVPACAYGTMDATRDDDDKDRPLVPRHNILDGWSPILSLLDVLNWLIAEMTSGGTAFQNNNQPLSIDTDSHSDNDTLMPTAGAVTHEGSSSFLPPNRFDVGYQRPEGFVGGQSTASSLVSSTETTSSMMDISSTE